MPAITQSIVIDRPCADVFAFACDYRNDARWRSGVVAMRIEPAGPTRLGSTTHETMRLMGRTIVTEGEVTRFETGRLIAFRSTSGPIPVHGHREVVADGAGSRFTFTIESRPRGVWRVMAPLMERTFERRLADDLRRLKAELEREPRDA